MEMTRIEEVTGGCQRLRPDLMVRLIVGEETCDC